MKVSVITIVSGRHAHLARQLDGLSTSELRPHEHVVVSMGDAQVPDVLSRSSSPTTHVAVDHSCGPLPLARARNIGAARAMDGGAELLVFLDVDCIPGTEMLGLYRTAAQIPEHHGSLLCGPVTYLGELDSAAAPSELPALVHPHAARPDPVSGSIEVGTNFDLFWSLSFAVTAETWHSVGGFCEDYCGYGGEDTDFAATAHSCGVGLAWVGGAHAYHQYHPVSNPPTEHLFDIVTNARIFHSRWGRWPMTGWLDSFEKLGLLTRGEDGSIVIQAPIDAAISGHDSLISASNRPHE